MIDNPEIDYNEVAQDAKEDGRLTELLVACFDALMTEYGDMDVNLLLEDEDALGLEIVSLDEFLSANVAGVESKWFDKVED